MSFEGQPLITVAVLIHRNDFLEDALKSIKQQTYGHLEIYMVDDTASVQTAQTCTRFEEEDQRFIYI